MSQGGYFCTIDPESHSLDAQFTEASKGRLAAGGNVFKPLSIRLSVLLLLMTPLML